MKQFWVMKNGQKQGEYRSLDEARNESIGYRKKLEDVQSIEIIQVEKRWAIVATQVTTVDSFSLSEKS